MRGIARAGVRNVRFTPERSQVMTRQGRILRSTAIIEVPEDMYSRGRKADLD